MGVASRRKADELISQGRVSINGEVIDQLGTKINPKGSEIAVDGVPLDPPSKKSRYLLLYKPKNVVTTLSDPEGRPTIRDYLPKQERLYPVGRLDYDTDGVLLITNDGDLAHQLAHPSFGIKKTYVAKVKGHPDPATISKLRAGVRLEDGFAKPLSVKFERKTSDNSWYRITVGEGRHHLIKRLWLRLGHPVQKLTRVEFASLKLDYLQPGQCRELSRAEVEKLRTLVQDPTAPQKEKSHSHRRPRKRPRP